MKQFKFLHLIFPLVSLLLLAALQPDTVMAEPNTINPAISYTIRQPSPNVTYTNQMPLSFVYDVTYTDPSVDSLGLGVTYCIDKGSKQSIPTLGWYDEIINISRLSNGRHELSVYIQAPYVYNGTIFLNTLKLFSVNFSVLNIAITPIPTVAITPTPTVPEFSWLMILPLIFILSMAVTVRLRKTWRITQH